MYMHPSFKTHKTISEQIKPPIECQIRVTGRPNMSHILLLVSLETNMNQNLVRCGCPVGINIKEEKFKYKFLKNAQVVVL